MFIINKSNHRTEEPVAAKTCDEHPKCPGPDVRKCSSSRAYRKEVAREETIKFGKLLDTARKARRAKTSTLIAVCCHREIEMRKDECGGPHRKLVRITADDDVTTGLIRGCQ